MKFTSWQEVRRKHVKSAADNSAVEAGQGPAAMSTWPLLQFVQNLGNFDFVALLLGAAVVFFSTGFLIDYIVGRYGMGPYWNGFYAMLGAYGGLCVRNWWLQPYGAYDPYLTTVVIAGGLLTTVVMVSAVAKR
jgi:hypothetical protein